MKISKAALLDAVAFPSSNIKARASNAIFSYLRWESKDNKLSITACDCDQYCIQQVDCEGSIAPVCVSIAQLRNVSALFGDDVEISLKESRLHISSNGQFILNTIPADQFPAWKLDNSTKVGVDCSALAAGIKKVVFAAATHDDKPRINCVHVSTDEKRILCEACNGRDYAGIESKLICGTSDFTVALSFVNNFCAALNRDGAVLVYSENSIGVLFDRGEFHCKQLVDKFLDVSAMTNWKFNKLGTISPYDWAPVFRSILGMAGKQSTTVISAKVSPGYIEYSGTNGQISASVKDKLKECDLNLSAVAFLPCLDAFNGETAKMSLCEENKGVCLEQGDLKVITMQLR